MRKRVRGTPGSISLGYSARAIPLLPGYTPASYYTAGHAGLLTTAGRNSAWAQRVLSYPGRRYPGGHFPVTVPVSSAVTARSLEPVPGPQDQVLDRSRSLLDRVLGPLLGLVGPCLAPFWPCLTPFGTLFDTLLDPFGTDCGQSGQKGRLLNSVKKIDENPL